MKWKELLDSHVLVQCINDQCQSEYIAYKDDMGLCEDCDKQAEVTVISETQNVDLILDTISHLLEASDQDDIVELPYVIYNPLHSKENDWELALKIAEMLYVYYA